MKPLSSIPQAITALKKGQMIIVMDDEDRENEGDLVVAAEHITEEQMAFVIRHTGGVVCLALSAAIADQLHLPAMMPHNVERSTISPLFTVSIEAARGVTTGISAADRTRTIRTAIRKNAKPFDLVRPGHVFPLRSHDGGVLVRTGHTEASVDLCRLAGLREGAVISELMHENGTMMRRDAIYTFAKTHRIPVITIADLIAHRRKHETLIEKITQSPLETDTGLWTIALYRDTVTQHEHLALVMGKVTADRPTLVRVHSECLTGDALGSLHCDCGWQLRSAMERIAAEGNGVILYMRQEGRGIGLSNKLRAYALQHTHKLDTVDANLKLGFGMDLREYGIGAQILRDLRVREIRLLTNNPKKISGLSGFGLSVVEQLPIKHPSPSARQQRYLKTKKEKMGHLL